MGDKKISIKNIYLLLTICVGLVCLGVGSTYAVFTANAEISSPISLASNLTYNSQLIEVVDVDVASGAMVTTIFNLTNNTTSTFSLLRSSSTTVNYTVFYIDQGHDIDIGTNTGTMTGTINSGDSKSVGVDVRNNSEEDLTVTIGVISSISSSSGSSGGTGTSSIVLGSSMKVVPDDKISYAASDLYYDNTNTGAECSDAQCMIDLINGMLEEE